MGDGDNMSIALFQSMIHMITICISYMYAINVHMVMKTEII